MSSPKTKHTKTSQAKWAITQLSPRRESQDLEKARTLTTNRTATRGAMMETMMSSRSFVQLGSTFLTMAVFHFTCAEIPSCTDTVLHTCSAGKRSEVANCRWVAVDLLIWRLGPDEQWEDQHKDQKACPSTGKNTLTNNQSKVSSTASVHKRRIARQTCS